MTDEQKTDAINEANLTKNLKHPNLVVCHKTFEAGDNLNILLEFCEN